MRTLSVIGTRPEGVKLAPVVTRLRSRGHVARVCASGQHPDLLPETLAAFGLEADLELRLRRGDGSLNLLLARLVEALDPVLQAEAPDWVLVQGDTTSALAAALAATHRRIPVAHVEAGLRTGDRRSPWPEETNRRLIDHMAQLLLAPTAQARSNLEAELAPGRVVLTGNTAIDAIAALTRRLAQDTALAKACDLRLPRLAPERLVLITGHRREAGEEGFGAMCAAAEALARNPGVQVVYVLHPSPASQASARARLKDVEDVHLCEPLPPPAFVRLMQRADVIMTDSGGIQEEASFLGRPVVVTRDHTERQEAVLAGAAVLTGLDADRMVTAVLQAMARPALDDPRIRTLFGDGRAAERIVEALEGRAVSEWDPAGETEDTAPQAASSRA